MITYTIAIQKGGTGKTMTAAALAYYLATQKGKRVLAVDLDEQKNLTYTMRGSAGLSGPTVYDVLTGKATAQAAISRKEGTPDLIPSSLYMAAIPVQLKGPGSTTRLRDALKPLAPAYDYCVIDTAPNLSLSTLNGIAAASSVIIPTRPDVLNLMAVKSICETIRAMSGGPSIAGILITQYTAHRNLTEMAVQQARALARTYGTKVFDTKIRTAIKLAEAQGIARNPWEYAPNNNGAIDYAAFSEELIGEEPGHEKEN